MKSYPEVLTEADTIAAAKAGMSLARWGDGEYSIMLGGNCVSQRGSPELARELRQVILKPGNGCLPCIPNIAVPELPAHKAKGWAKFRTEPRYLNLLGDRSYGSSFISRPDSAPWIDTPEYWASVRDLWAGRDVVLVTGHYNEIRLNQCEGAHTILEVVAPRQHAYAQIDEIENQILVAAQMTRTSHGGYVPQNPLVIMCLGPTATVLAARLTRRGIQALDLGHCGMFMRHAGQYRVQLDQLITMGYQDELLAMHASQKGWGGDGAKHADAVRKLIEDFKPLTVLDYGCGQGKLREAMEGQFRILEYDPGVPGKAGMPKPVDLVICSDVLEHVEPKMVANVLSHIERVAEKVAYFVISTRPAKLTLPGGRNCHLSIHDGGWWVEQIEKAGFRGLEVETIGDEVRVLARRAR